MHIHADVTPCFVNRFTGMQSHPHPQRCITRPDMLAKSPLRCDGRRHGISGAGKCHQEGIPLSVDFLAVPPGECGTKQAPMLHDDIRVTAVAEALEERGGPLDVGEEEGDRPGRQGLQN